MGAPPYMKLYVADYLGDTHHLGVVEHGAYLLLLMAMWRAGGSLPAADANLARLARCTPEQWTEVREIVLPFFRRSRGRISHKRLADELAKYENTSGKRSEAGKAGGSKKRNENNTPIEANAYQTESNCRHNQNQNQNQNQKIDSAADDSAREPLWPLSDPPTGEQLDALAELLRSVAGACLNAASVKLLTLAPILSLSRSGPGPPCDLAADIVPAVRACAARAEPGSVRSWDYFVPAIREARDRRLRGAPAEGPIHERPASRPDQRHTAYLERLGDIDAAMAAAFQPGRGVG